MENLNRPKTKGVRLLVATMAVLQQLVNNPQTSEDELMGIIRGFTGDDEDLTGAVCFAVLGELQRVKRS